MYSRRGFISAINYVKDAIISFYFSAVFAFITFYFTSIFIPFYCSTFTFQHYLFNTYYSALFFVNLPFSTICCFIKTFQHYLFYIYFLALFVSIYFLALFVSIYFLALFISKFTFSTICLWIYFSGLFATTLIVYINMLYSVTLTCIFRQFNPSSC